MQILKNLKFIFLILLLLLVKSPAANSTEECFEKTSRAIFKFNSVFDDVILGPIAKGYNKLPEPIKNGTSNFTSNVATLLSIPNLVINTLLSPIIIACRHNEHAAEVEQPRPRVTASGAAVST